MSLLPRACFRSPALADALADATASFLYVEPLEDVIRFTAFYPSSGPADGGTTVSFGSATNMSASFLGESIHGRISVAGAPIAPLTPLSISANGMELRLVMPPVPPGSALPSSASIHFTANGVDFTGLHGSDAGVPFTYVTPHTTRGAFPMMGDANGGSMVTLIVDSLSPEIPNHVSVCALRRRVLLFVSSSQPDPTLGCHV